MFYITSCIILMRFLRWFKSKFKHKSKVIKHKFIIIFVVEIFKYIIHLLNSIKIHMALYNMEKFLCVINAFRLEGKKRGMYLQYIILKKMIYTYTHKKRLCLESFFFFKSSVLLLHTFDKIFK